MELSQEILAPILDRACQTHYWQKRRGEAPFHKRTPLTPELIHAHLNGGSLAVGLAPIAPGESVTRIAVLDFDAHGGFPKWPEMSQEVIRILSIAQRQGLRGVPFRSSGGRGVHAFFLWDDPQDAYSVRELLKSVLAAAGFKAGTKGVAAREVEVFPKQDHVPEKRWGSMFVLPFWGESVALNPPIDLGEPSLLPTEFPTWVMSDPVATRPKPGPQGPVNGSQGPTGEGESEIEAPEPSESFPHVERALAAIDPNCSYDVWLRALAAVHHETQGSEEGLAIVDAWSSTGLTYPGTEAITAKWASFTRDESDVVTLEWLEARAREAKVATAEDFPEEPESENPAGTDAPEGSKSAVKIAFHVEHFTEFTTRPTPTWLIPGLLPRASLGVIYGPPGSGKTFWAMDIAFTLAQGLSWQHHPVEPVRTIYMAAEAPSSVAHRARRLAEVHAIDGASIALSFIGSAPNLLMQDHKKVIAAIKAHGGCDVLFIDTLSRVLAGGNENAPDVMGPVIKHLLQISDAIGCMVVLVHHTGKDEARGMRGHSSLSGAAEVIIEISRAGNERFATAEKLKDYQDGAVFPFQLLPGPTHIDALGHETSTCTVIYPEGQASAPKTRTPRLAGVNEVLLWEGFSDLQLSQVGEGNPVPVDMLLTEVASRMVMTEADRRGRDQRKGRAKSSLDGLQERAVFYIRDDLVRVL